MVDGYTGTFGRTLIKAIKEVYPHIEIVAIGTNEIATANMLKAGAHVGGTGENSLRRAITKADVIIGPLGIVIAHGLMGEVTPGMAELITTSPASKILIPFTKENVVIVGFVPEPLPHLVDKIVHQHLRSHIV